MVKELFGGVGNIKAIGFERWADQLRVAARLSAKARTGIFGAIIAFSDI